MSHGDTETDASDVQSLSAASIDQIEKGDFATALVTLKRLEQFSSSGKSTLDLLIHHNSAYCHLQCPPRRLGQTDLCVRHLEACYNQSPVVAGTKAMDNALADRFKAKNYEFRVGIQLCGILSQTGSHLPALMYAKAAARAAHVLVNESLALCMRLLAKAKAVTGLTFSEFDSSLDAETRLACDLSLSARPVLEYMDSKMKGKPTSEKPPKISMRSTLGVQRYSEWIYSVTVKDLMQLEPLTLYELRTGMEPVSELARDRLVEKVCKLVTAYYCVATELRLGAGESVGKGREAQLWHHRALEIAQDLLPMECVLVEHLCTSYNHLYVFLSPTAEKQRARSASANPGSRKGKDSPYKRTSKLNFQSPSQIRRLKTHKLEPQEAQSETGSRKSEGNRHWRLNQKGGKDVLSPFRRTPNKTPPLPKIA